MILTKWFPSNIYMIQIFYLFKSNVYQIQNVYKFVLWRNYEL